MTELSPEDIIHEQVNLLLDNSIDVVLEELGLTTEQFEVLTQLYISADSAGKFEYCTSYEDIVKTFLSVMYLAKTSDKELISQMILDENQE